MKSKPLTSDNFHSTYKEVNIYKVIHNGMYYCYTNDGVLRADTLKGMRAAITAYKNGESVWGF